MRAKDDTRSHRGCRGKGRSVEEQVGEKRETSSSSV